MLGDLVAELDAHADVGNAAEERFEHRLGLVAVAVGREVGEDASQLIARDKCSVGANHDVVACGKIPERQQLANGGRLETSSCSAYVIGIANLPAQSSRTFNLQLLLHDPRQWNDPLMESRCEDNARKHARAASMSRTATTVPFFVF